MEPQMPRPHVDQSYDHEHLPPSVGLPPPSVTEGEEDDHHHHHHQEKKSVLKKVKAKAKKIKETLTKHGHGHDHEHEHDYHQRHHIDEEEEDEDEDEMVEDSEVHGAPSGEEAGITPILQSFKKMNVYDNDEEPESKQKPQGATNLYTGSHDQFSPEPLPLHTTTNREDPGSVLKRFDATKPEDMPRDTFSKQPSDQSIGYTYTEKISSATSAIADKAVTAKNVVASKLLGYGSNEDTTATSTSTSTKNTHQGDEETTDKAGSVAEYGHKIAAAVTEKLAPMYEKVTDVGSSVMSKVHNTCTDTDTSTGQERGDKGQDGGVSVKEYLVKKLRPSEEDKLLSEMISDALHKRKQEVEVVEEKPMGKVTESEEVARRLGNNSRGSSDEDSSIREGTAADSGKAVAVAVVDRLKGAVSTWFFSGRDQSQTSQPSLAHAGQEQMSSSTGEEVGYGHGQDDGVGDR
ncbi:Low-temperature-induced 65 kDa protein [Camellia lanceoleosa]|uniref:Low-temperature-induced 65 kDa protein n=1 Tax=Camellia lanceoleosa TaxID=1840588 RepID=A0ACC0J6B5_9ERIC|nr:Low-temperature-induced 65 kDa protein [Camellia lanceoleosa]